MQMESIFGALQVGASFLGFFGPIGSAMGAVFSTDIGMAEQMISPGVSVEQKLLSLPESVQLAQNHYYSGTRGRSRVREGGKEEVMSHVSFHFSLPTK